MTQNILFIIDGLPGGGAERVVLTLAEGMLQQGHKVTLISLRNVCTYTLPAQLQYIVVEDNAHGPFRKLNEIKRRAMQLDRILEQQQAQGYFTHIFSNLHKTDRIVTQCKTLATDKVWLCIHGMLSTSYLGHKRGFSRLWKRIKLRHVYQQRQIIGVSHAVIADLQQQLGVHTQKSRVIYNPFDFNTIRQHASAPCDWSSQPYLLHMGRLHPHKRHDRLLDAYARANLMHPLLLIGEGSEQAQANIKQQAQTLGIADRVHYLGFQANPYPYLRHAKMLILSSDSEGFGNVLVEALVCGTQVVSTPCPGGPEEILQGDLRRGLSADMSAASLALAIQEIEAHPVDLSTVDLSRFSLHTICEQYLAC
ncbi:MAG: glycosyltransferase [Plesiomonas sp.]|uniref:glycosyltransferase n=1 Tax=Plesiomonas sp. TaxID=2486279 RepID=UPI003F3B543D